MQKELPGLQGFSERNIRNMRQFYETWSKPLIWQPAAAEMADQEKWQPSAAENQSPMATQLLLTPSRLDFSRDVFDVEMAHDFLSFSLVFGAPKIKWTNIEW